MEYSWDHVEVLFEAALGLPADRRSAFLDESCRQSPALRQELASLLAADRAPADFLRSPLRAAADSGEPDWPADDRIDGYEISRPIGRGATGTVYLANQVDAGFSRPVAIKVLRRVDDPDQLRRFHLERRILASLEHPNLARLYDGGTTRDGRPYLVLEYVEGVNIDRYCDQHELSIEKRLCLVRTVALAVHTAHQNLIVHRDLKPANILVTAEGIPKLLDFGIAKLLDPALAGGAEATAAWVRLLTPHYASPEQIHGRTITTASDVYALGVLLYNLLTGQLPHDFSGRDLEAIERILAEVEPPPPSAVVTIPDDRQAPDARSAARQRSLARGLEPPALARRLAGDLDSIVLKALRKEPHHRYGSAEQLAEDLRRSVAGLPVLARRGTWAYRAGKLVRRHRLASTVTGLFLAVTVGAAATIAVQSVHLAAERDRAAVARDRAVAERDRAQETLDFVVELFDITAANRSEPQLVTARDVLAHGADLAHRELAGQPAVQARLLAALGTAYCRLGLYEEGIPLLESGLDTARAAGSDAIEVADLADALGTQLVARGELDRGEALHQEALALYRHEHAEPNESVATALARLAWVDHQRGHFEAAGRRYREALALRRQLLPESDQAIRDNLNSLGLLALHQGRHAEAEVQFREVLRLEEKAGVGETINHAASLNNVAQVRYESGDLPGSEALLREVLRILLANLSPDHPRVAQAQHNLGSVLVAQGRYDEARPLLETALDSWRAHYGERHRDVASALASLGICRFRQGDLAEAERLLSASVARFAEALGEGHPVRAKALLGLARVVCARGRLAEGEAAIRQAVAIWQQSLPPDHWWHALGDSVLAGCLIPQGRLAEAATLLSRAQPRIEAQVGRDDPESQDTRARLRALAAGG